MSSFLLTRRSALLGGLTSLILPASAVNLHAAVAIDPWDAIAEQAFALQDSMRALPAPWYYFHELGLYRTDEITAHNKIGSGAPKYLRRQGADAHG